MVLYFLLALKNYTIRFFLNKATRYNTEIDYRTSKQEITTHQNKIQNLHKSRRCHKLNFDWKQKCNVCMWEWIQNPK